MLLEKLKNIQAFVFDVDGVFTDGSVLVNESGEQLRRFNIKDGYAVQLAVKRGYQVVILSGGHSKGVELRLRGLGVQKIHLGLESKFQVFQDFINQSELRSESVLFMGDDIPDLGVAAVAGMVTCPADAVEEIKALSHYISPKNGGEGCVRDVIEKVLKLRGDWYEADPSAHDGSLK